MKDTLQICEYKPMPVISETEASIPLSKDESYYCEICERLFVGTLQWNAHKKSKKHQRVVRKKKLLELAQSEEILTSMAVEQPQGELTLVNSVPEEKIKSTDK